MALVAPLQPSDRQRYVAALGHVSADSLFKRFLTPVTTLTASQLRYLLEVDHADHEALLAVDEDGGEAVGVARFVRLHERPEHAEAAVIVIDDWQSNGLGKALCLILAERARELGIVRFEATLAVENKAMMGLLRSLGPVREIGREGAAVVVTLKLGETGLGAPLEDVLRVAAEGGVEAQVEAAPATDT